MKYLILLLLSFFFYSTGLHAQMTVRGYVIDLQKAEPIENATVFVHDEFNIALKPPIRTTTDENGYYEITDLEYGTYNINAFIYYEMEGDTFAFVFQPGNFTLEEANISNYFKDKGYQYSFAFSKEYFKYLYHKERNEDVYPHPHQWQIISFLKPRIETNARPFFDSRPTMFIEKKTW